MTSGAQACRRRWRSFRVGVTTAALLAPATAGLLATEGTTRATAAPSASWWYEKMQVAQANQTSTGQGVTIGLIDGTIDPTAAELAGQHLVPVGTLCLDHLPPVGTGPVAFHATSMAVLMIGSGHGTLPGGGGIRGVAPAATVRSYTVYDHVNDKAAPGQGDIACGESDPAAALSRAIKAAVNDGVDIISISLTATPDPDMISYALDHGVVIVAAAGDQATVVGPPANSRGVVAVSAVDVDAKPASKANGGDSLVVMAPGVDVSSGSVDALGHWSSAGVQSGSSASTALVAAGLALVKARYPTATGNQLIQDLIHNTGGDHPFGHTSQFGFGIMSLSRMLAADPTGLPNVNPLRAEGPAAVDPAAALPSAAGSSAPAVATRTSRHSRLPWVAFGVLALALAAAVLIIIALRRRRPAALSPEQPSLVSAGSKEN